MKIALLKYLSSLIAEMDPRKFSSSNSEITFAFMKIISWTTMPKSSDIRKVCFYCFVLHFEFLSENFVHLIGYFIWLRFKWPPNIKSSFMIVINVFKLTLSQWLWRNMLCASFKIYHCIMYDISYVLYNLLYIFLFIFYFNNCEYVLIWYKSWLL